MCLVSVITLLLSLLRQDYTLSFILLIFIIFYFSLQRRGGLVFLGMVAQRIESYPARSVPSTSRSLLLPFVVKYISWGPACPTLTISRWLLHDSWEIKLQKFLSSFICVFFVFAHWYVARYGTHLLFKVLQKCVALERWHRSVFYVKLG